MAYGFHVHPKEYTADVRGFSFVVERDGDLYKAYKSGKGLTFEDDDASAVIQSAMDVVSSENGGVVLLKPAIYEITKTLVMKDYVVLKGEVSPVRQVTWSEQYVDRGAVLKLSDGANVPIVEAESGVKVRSIGLVDLVFDGNKDNQTEDVDVLYFYNGSEILGLDIIRCKIFNGSRCGIYLRSVWKYKILHCEIAFNKAPGIYMTLLPDNGLVWGNIIHDNEGRGIDVYSNGAYLIIAHNHVHGNGYDGIRIKDTSYAIIQGNHVMNNGIASDNTYAGIVLENSKYCIVSENYVGTEDSIDNRMKYAVIEFGDSDYNVISSITYYRIGTLPISFVGSHTRVIGVRGYRNSGVATFSGDGSTTEFKIEHGLVKAPSKYGVSPLTPDAHADKTISADDTYITITFSTAPPSGTDNLKFSWWAEV